ncbi:MAG: thiamine-phosphate kinase [Isosphaeraceae bacterium]
MSIDPLPSEFSLIRWIRERTHTSPATILGIGDDAAILRPTPGSDLVVTTDMLMDGRHFHLDPHSPEAVGYKALAVNLSDIAAMAARPVAAVVAVALPRDWAADVARGLHAGLSEAAAAFGVSLIGGDTNAWDGPLVISVTLLGETVGRGPVRRSGAQADDVIYVTGPLGGSILGRHLRPTPRVAEALALNAAVPIHALIDISDGLAADLDHILEESGGLGALLQESAIPVHADAHTVAEMDGIPPLQHALNDGEDFELCLVVSHDDAAKLDHAPPQGVRLYRIGQVVSMPGLWLIDDHGKTRIIEPIGFDHLR